MIHINQYDSLSSTKLAVNLKLFYVHRNYPVIAYEIQNNLSHMKRGHKG